MGRKRLNELPKDVPVNTDGTAVMEPEANGKAREPPPPAPTEPKKNRPVAGFAANSDRTTRLEVAVWARQVRPAEGEEYTQYSLTLSRAWKDKNEQWTENDFYRAHDVPVLLYLIQQAHHWCIEQRMAYRTGMGEQLPF